MSTPDFAGMEPSASLPNQPARPDPRRFGDYLLVDLLGYGGMGEVWLAKQTALGIDTFCVIKTIKPELSGDVEYRTRFVDEARVVVQLTHRNICHVFDVGVVGREYFFAMELVAGFDFRKLFLAAQARNAPIGETVALHLVCEILEALDYAHRLADVSTGEPLHLVHRDVSQQNLLVSLEGEVKLIDFGLAKSRIKQLRTEVGIVHGKMAYMAPEQARGEHVDPRADQFAAGVVAYELLAGARYYGDLSPGEISTLMIAGLYRPQGFATVPEPIRAILHRALSGDREERFPSCAAFRKALIACAAQRGTLGGSDDVRALIDGMFPNARSDHRARMTNAAAAANAAIAVPVEESERIAASRPRIPLALAPRTLEVPRISLDTPRTEIERAASTDSGASEAHDTTEEVRAPASSDSADRVRRLDDRTDVVDRSPGEIALATLVITDPSSSSESAPRTLPERNAFASSRAAFGAVVALVVVAGVGAAAFVAGGGPSRFFAHPPAVAPLSAPSTASPIVSPSSAVATIATAAKATNAVAPEPQLVEIKANDAHAKITRPHKTHVDEGARGDATPKPHVQLPSTAPASLPELVRLLESSCADVVPCAGRMRARLVEANQSPDVDAVRGVRASAEQCFTECKASAP